MKQYDVEYSKLASGAIRLKQDAYGGDDVIDLHPAQLRQIAEHFELVTPAPAADELSKLLAEQLCRVFLTMADDYRHLSHALEDEYARLDGFISAIPSEIFPYYLWEERDEAAAPRAEAQRIEQTAGNSVDAASAEKDAAGQQMGLDV